MIRGDNREQSICTRAAAFARARGIRSEGQLGQLLDEPAADIDSDSLTRLRQIHESGGWVLVESGVVDLPSDLRWLYASGAVTLEQLATLHESLEVTSIADIAAALDDGVVRGQTGFDSAVEQAIANALPTLRGSVPRIPLGRATAIAEPLLDRLRSIHGVSWAEPVGSLRRGEDTVGDVELMAPVADPAPPFEQLMLLPDIAQWLHRSERRFYFFIDRTHVGIRFPKPENAGASLLYYTGSRAHFAALQAQAAAVGLQLSAAGLHDREGRLQPARFEDEIYAALGLTPIPPEIRNGDEEVLAASRGELPVLVSLDDIRGDLHMHSVWSDGRDTIETMVVRCRTLGYEYVAITDHSPSSAASRNLTTEGVAHQADEIAQLRERYPDIAILHGCEADILPDGRLDFPDHILERFDIVLASLHERAGQAADQLMKRYQFAMRHPLVSLITHPTNRLVPSRAPYDLDYDLLFSVAAETGTIVEIDGAPGHLDLDGALARRAVAAGAMLAVNSDCHRAELLQRQMRLGVQLARRGWVERRHVVNTRPLDQVLTTIARKRASR
jgi:DNA polymerase (family X)